MSSRTSQRPAANMGDFAHGQQTSDDPRAQEEGFAVHDEVGRKGRTLTVIIFSVVDPGRWPDGFHLLLLGPSMINDVLQRRIVRNPPPPPPENSPLQTAVDPVSPSPYRAYGYVTVVSKRFAGNVGLPETG